MNIKEPSSKILNKHTSLSEGYTLIEVIIAMAITSIAFVAIYALFVKTMQSDAESRYEIVAAALSQEGIEIIKNKREKNEMDWAMWNPVDDSSVPPSSFKDIDNLLECNPELDLTIPGYNFSCNSGSSINMQYNRSDSSKKYESGCSGVDCIGPIFERRCETNMIDTDPILNPGVDSLRVSCLVEWKSLLLGGQKRNVKTEIILTDWQR